MKRLGFFWFAILSCLFLADAAGAERRVALVMGNGEYQHAARLPNPANDATAMAELFRNLGFEVIEGTNLDRQAMAARIYAFANLSSGADAAIFFYAGHGLSLDGKNYLIPVDADLRNETDVKLGSAIDADISINQALADAKVKIVFLDACRDNPFAQAIKRSLNGTRSTAVMSGLSEMKSGSGTLIAFATGPGQVALDGKSVNSPFTAALLQHLAEPGLEIRLAMTKVRAQVAEDTGNQQTPWENTNLTGFFYMNVYVTPAPQGATPDANASATTAAPGGDFELEFWKSVKDTTDPGELKAYLTRYPSGNFAAIARTRLAALEAAEPAKAGDVSRGPEPTAPLPEPSNLSTGPTARTAEASHTTEEALGLDRAARSGVQVKLDRLGFSSHSSDGNFGPSTRLALAGWQTARHYVVTGYLNRYQFDALVAEVAAPAAEKPAAKARTVTVKAKPKPVAAAKPKPAKPKPAVVTVPPKKKKPLSRPDNGRLGID